jgi:hypothetical protein
VPGRWQLSLGEHLSDALVRDAQIASDVDPAEPHTNVCGHPNSLHIASRSASEREETLSSSLAGGFTDGGHDVGAGGPRVGQSSFRG